MFIASFDSLTHAPELTSDIVMCEVVEDYSLAEDATFEYAE